MIDDELAGGTGLHFSDQIQQQNAFPPIPGILLNAPPASCALEPRPLWVVQEPCDLDTLLTAVKQATLWQEVQSPERSCHTQGGEQNYENQGGFLFFRRADPFLGIFLRPDDCSRQQSRASSAPRPAFPEQKKTEASSCSRSARENEARIDRLCAPPRRPPGFPVREALPVRKEARTLVDHEPALPRRQ